MIVGILTVLGSAVGFFVVGAAVTTWVEAGNQQCKDWLRYGRWSSRWQIALEIWGLRKVDDR